MGPWWAAGPVHRSCCEVCDAAHASSSTSSSRIRRRQWTGRRPGRLFFGKAKGLSSGRRGDSSGGVGKGLFGCGGEGRRGRGGGLGDPGMQYEQADGQQPAGAWGQPAASSQQPAASSGIAMLVPRRSFSFSSLRVLIAARPGGAAPTVSSTDEEPGTRDEPRWCLLPLAHHRQTHCLAHR